MSKCRLCLPWVCFLSTENKTHTWAQAHRRTRADNRMLTSKSQPRRTAGAQGAPGGKSVDLGVLGGRLGSPSDFLCDLGQVFLPRSRTTGAREPRAWGTPVCQARHWALCLQGHLICPICTLSLGKPGLRERWKNSSASYSRGRQGCGAQGHPHRPELQSLDLYRSLLGRAAPSWGCWWVACHQTGTPGR